MFESGREPSRGVEEKEEIDPKLQLLKDHLESLELKLSKMLREL